MSEEERFDPRRHTLDYAAERLKKISEKNYRARLDEVLGRHEEESTGLSGTVRDENTNKLATGGFIENFPLIGNESGHEYLVRDEPVRMGWLEAALLDTEQMANESVDEEMDEPVVLEPGESIAMAWWQSYTDRMNSDYAAAQPYGAAAIPTYTYTYNAKNPALLNPITESRICDLVERAVHKALYGESDGLVNTRHHRRVTLHEDGGDEWTGVLYKREKESDSDG